MQHVDPDGGGLLIVGGLRLRGPRKLIEMEEKVKSSSLRYELE